MGLMARMSAFAHRRSNSRGQGMTEYAILIGVVVVIGIVVFLLRDQIANLFNGATHVVSNLNTAMNVNTSS